MDAIGGRALEEGQAAQQPFGREHLQAIAQARQQSRKIGRAAMVAAISGWTTAVFAFITILGGIFSFPAFLLGAGLAVAASIEIRGSQALRRFDVHAPRRLALNQIALFAMLAAYSAWCIVVALTGASPFEHYRGAGADVDEALAPYENLYKLITVCVYAAVIAISLVAQGCAAAYYLTRRRHIVSYLSSTPKWVVETLRIAA